MEWDIKCVHINYLQSLEVVWSNYSAWLNKIAADTWWFEETKLLIALWSEEVVQPELNKYNKSDVKPIGRKKMRVRNPKNNNMYTVEFIIIKGQCKSILGLKTCEELELLTVNRQKYLTSYFTIDKYTRFVRTRYSQFSKVKESLKANCTWS